jgi:biotin operon repressor
VRISITSPLGIAIDGRGNLYVTDTRKIRKVTPAGVVSTFAGSGASGTEDGSAATATFASPHGITVDGSGAVLVTDIDSDTIRKIQRGASAPDLEWDEDYYLMVCRLENVEPVAMPVVSQVKPAPATLPDPVVVEAVTADSMICTLDVDAQEIQRGQTVINLSAAQLTLLTALIKVPRDKRLSGQDIAQQLSVSRTVATDRLKFLRKKLERIHINIEGQIGKQHGYALLDLLTGARPRIRMIGEANR